MIRRDEVVTLTKSGVTSEQLLFPENSRSTRVTVTRATVSPPINFRQAYAADATGSR